MGIYWLSGYLVMQQWCSYASRHERENQVNKPVQEG